MLDRTLLRLVNTAHEDPSRIPVLADYYEQAGMLQWSDWLRNPEWTPKRLAWSLRKSGFRTASSDRAFHASTTLSGPFSNTMCWRVKTPGRLPELLATPVFALFDRLHLGSLRGRTAAKRVLEMLSDRPLHTLDVWDEPVEPALFTHRTLNTLCVRVHRRVERCTAKRLGIRIRRPSDLHHWTHTELPHVTEIELRPYPRDLRFPVEPLRTLQNAPHLERIVVPEAIPPQLKLEMWGALSIPVRTHPPLRMSQEQDWRVLPPDPQIVLG